MSFINKIRVKAQNITDTNLLLTITIVVMQICAIIVAIINKYFPEEVKENKYQTKKPDNSSEIALAIACALCKGGIKC